MDWVKFITTIVMFIIIKIFSLWFGFEFAVLMCLTNILVEIWDTKYVIRKGEKIMNKKTIAFDFDGVIHRYSKRMARW